MPQYDDDPQLNAEEELKRTGQLLISTFLSDEKQGAEKPSDHARPGSRESNRNHHIFTLGARRLVESIT